MKDNLPDHPFWRFSCKICERETAPVAALSYLQKSQGLNPSLILFCCWFAASGQGRLNKQDILRLNSSIGAWHERIIAPLYQLQAVLEKTRLAWYAKETRKEKLIATQIEQLMLAEVALKTTKNSKTPPHKKLIDACKNIVTYCKTQQALIDASTYQSIYPILIAAFPELESGVIREICRPHFQLNLYSQQRLDLN